MDLSFRGQVQGVCEKFKCQNTLGINFSVWLAPVNHQMVLAFSESLKTTVTFENRPGRII